MCFEPPAPGGLRVPASRPALVATAPLADSAAPGGYPPARHGRGAGMSVGRHHGPPGSRGGLPPCRWLAGVESPVGRTHGPRKCGNQSSLRPIATTRARTVRQWSYRLAGARSRVWTCRYQRRCLTCHWAGSRCHRLHIAAPTRSARRTWRMTDLRAPGCERRSKAAACRPAWCWLAPLTSTTPHRPPPRPFCRALAPRRSPAGPPDLPPSRPPGGLPQPGQGDP